MNFENNPHNFKLNPIFYYDNNNEHFNPAESLLNRMRREYIGQEYTTNDGYKVKVIDYKDKENVIIQFEYNGYIRSCSLNNLRKGKIGNPFHVNSYGGYVGVGPYKQKTPSKLYYDVWFGILTRIKKEMIEAHNGKLRTYGFVSICDEWRNFQTFASWYQYNESLLNPNYNYQIDKDILQWDSLNKIYSPETCCLIPRELNVAFDGLHVVREKYPELPLGVSYAPSGRYTVRVSYGTKDTNGVHLGVYDDPMEAFSVYKKEKEGYIRILADKFLQDGAILPHVRDAVYCIDLKPFNKY